MLCLRAYRIVDQVKSWNFGPSRIVTSQASGINLSGSVLLPKSTFFHRSASSKSFFKPMKRSAEESAPRLSNSSHYSGSPTKKPFQESQAPKFRSEDSILQETQRRRNLKLYNHYINEAAKRKSLGLAKQLFSQLQEQGLKPDEFTYTCMINASSRSYSLEDAESYLEQMKANQIQLNEVTYTAIIKGASNLFNLPKAKSFLDEMVESGIKPNPRTFNTILRACLRVGDFKLAMELQELMKKLNVQPDTSTLACLVQLYAQELKVGEACALLDQLETMVKAKNSNSDSKLHFTIDPSIFLLLGTTSILSGQPLKKSKAFLAKYDASIKEKKDNQTPENESRNLSPSDTLMEASYLRNFILGNEGLSKEKYMITKMGPKSSPFVYSAPKSPSTKEKLVFNDGHAPLSFSKENGRINKLEVCSGSGDWIISRAQNEISSNPNVHWYALEIRFDRVHEIWRKVILNRLEDRISIIHADAQMIKSLVPNATFDEVHINFPDPPHDPLSPQRMITSTFLQDIAKIIIPTGKLIVLSDDTEYCNWIATDARKLEECFDTSAIEYFTKVVSTSSKPNLESSDQGKNLSSFFDALWASRGRNERTTLTIPIREQDIDLKTSKEASNRKADKSDRKHKSKNKSDTIEKL